MRVSLSTPKIVLSPGRPADVEIEVTNDLEVIDGVSAFIGARNGLSWNTTPSLLALFPDSTDSLHVELGVSSTFPAGHYDIEIEVRSSIGAEEPSVIHLDLTIPPLPAGEINVDPLVRNAKHRTDFTVRVDNTGNTLLEMSLVATDPMRAAPASFTNTILTVAPGERSSTTMNVSSRRHWLGGDISHQLNIVGSADDLELDTKAVFRQRPLIPRGARTMAVLMTIVALWAAIFALVLDHAITRDPLTKDAPASFYAAIASKVNTDELRSLGGARIDLTSSSSASAPAGAVPKSGLVIGVGGTISGTVYAKSSGTGVGRINVSAVAQMSTGDSTVASAATTSNGSYSIEGLLPGTYKVFFEAQGYKTLWYPSATGSGGATTVTVDALGNTSGINATIEGLPGSISGLIDTGETPAAPVSITVEPEQGSTQPIATVRSKSDGSYKIPKLPTPGTYDLSFTAAGFQVASATDQLNGGESDVANTVTLSAAAGTISGTVTAGGHALGGVQITAQANGQTFTSATPTTGPVGQFSLVGLPSPATYLLTFTATGYGTRVIGEDLGPGQNLTGLSVVMEGGAGDISGTVLSAAGTPLGGATVTVQGGASPITTQTLTAGTIGGYTLSGLATPGTYTLTFSLTGYVSQTMAVSLQSSGSATGLSVHLPADIGTITGTVSSSSGTTLSGVTVNATNGVTVTSTSSTSQPAGGFLLANLPPGSYSITFVLANYNNETVLVDLAPGATSTLSVQMTPASS